MTNLNVQFADSSDAVIVSYFGAPQNAAIYGNMGTVDTSDAKWKDYFESQPVWVKPFLPAPT
jgi:hypothetical protein